MKLPRNEPLALLPSALSAEYDSPTVATGSNEPKVDSSGLAVVTVRGELVHHPHPYCDSYDVIKARVAQALSRPATRAVLLSIDSPGGQVSGCFDTVREIRALAQAANKPIYAYVDGTTASAAYALACAAQRIYVPETGLVGSIGVLEPVVDVTKLDQSSGVHITVVSSGARKTDGNPHVGISPESLASIQAHVDSLADRFFALVGEYRNLPPDQVKAQEAGLFIGQWAVAAGLADEVATEDQVVALISSGKALATTSAISTGNKPMTLAEIKEALKAKAEDEDGDESEKDEARKMLAALEPEKDEEAPKDEPKKDEEKKDEAKDSVASTEVQAMMARLQVLESERTARIETEQRASAMASRPDLVPEVQAWLATQPLAVVQSAVKTLPKGSVNVAHPAADAHASVRPTLATGHATSAIPSAGPDGQRLPDVDAIFGVKVQASAPVAMVGNVQQLSLVDPARAREALSALKAQAK